MSKAIAVLTLALITLASVSGLQAQQTTNVHRLGLLSARVAPAAAKEPEVEQFLRKLGYVAGQNLAIDARYANGQLDRLPELATELAHARPDVIVARGFPAAVAAKQATSTIPIVVLGAGDPVATGLVASFARPGGNITGVSALEKELSGKRLELLKEAVPRITRAAVLWNGSDLGMTMKFQEMERAAHALRLAIQASAVRRQTDFDDIFSKIVRNKPGAMFVITDFLTSSNRKRVFQFAAKNKMPAMYESTAYVEDGGLMAYGPSESENVERALYHVDKIFKGARPGDLPIEQPTRFELAINLKTAAQIGLTIPQSMLFRADKVVK